MSTPRTPIPHGDPPPLTPQQQALSHQAYQPFPNAFMPLVNGGGIIEPAWHQLFWSLWNASGVSRQSITEEAVYLTQISETVIAAYNAANGALIGFVNYQPQATSPVITTNVNFQMSITTTTYLVDSSQTSIVGTLPTGPSLGDKVTVSDSEGFASYNNIRILTSDGSKILGQSDYFINTSYGYVTLMWSGSQWVRTD